MFLGRRIIPSFVHLNVSNFCSLLAPDYHNLTQWLPYKGIYRAVCKQKTHRASSRGSSSKPWQEWAWEIQITGIPCCLPFSFESSENICLVFSHLLRLIFLQTAAAYPEDHKGWLFISTLEFWKCQTILFHYFKNQWQIQTIGEGRGRR